MLCISQDVIPITNPINAFIILILNILFPGIGTLVMACFSTREFILLNIIYGLIQIFTAMFIFGWIWAIIWGFLCVFKSESFNTIKKPDIIIINTIYRENNGPPVMTNQQTQANEPIATIVPQINYQNKEFKNYTSTANQEFRGANLSTNQGLPVVTNVAPPVVQGNLNNQFGQLNSPDIQMKQVQYHSVQTNILDQSKIPQKSAEYDLPTENELKNKK